MAFVKKIPEEKAGPELRDLYAQIRSSYGFLPNYFQALGLMPALIRAERALADTILADGELSRIVKEHILLVVSGINSSSYCIAAHLELLRKLGVEKSLGRKLATKYQSAGLAANELALLQFADKLTRDASSVSKADVNALFAASWSEKAVIEATLVAAWGNFINRVAFGLGLVADF